VVGNELVITHGNGPQVGVLALESAADPALTRAYPFDALVAETQGLIGNWLLSALGRAAPWARSVCLLTRTVVDEADSAFEEPSKFVGPIYTEDEAQRLASAHKWAVRPDGASWRRVVASPEPKDILELDEIELLLRHGHVVICAGGGGVPVVRDSEGYWRDVEAVVDKDFTAAVLAQGLKADFLLLLTDVPNVELDYGTPAARALRDATVQQLRALSFPAGSMGPKVEAACRFAEAGGTAAIGRFLDAPGLLNGRVGTIIRNAAPETPGSEDSVAAEVQQ
jgi:carbamate kinase